MLLCVRRATALACLILLGYVARGRCTRHERFNQAGARTAQGRTSLLLGKQLPVPLGDDFDDASGELQHAQRLPPQFAQGAADSSVDQPVDSGKTAGVGVSRRGNDAPPNVHLVKTLQTSVERNHATRPDAILP